MVVGPVELRRWEPRHDPGEQRLVPRVHPQRDLRLAAVAAEVALADEDADDQTDVEERQRRCFTVVFHVEPPGLRRGWRRRLFHRRVSRETCAQTS